MKTALMFAGVDAVDQAEDRARAAALPAVQARFAEAQRLLDAVSPKRVVLAALLEADDAGFDAPVLLRGLLSAVTQVGLGDHLAATGVQPDYVVGCSLGDLARGVYAGALPFEAVVLGLYGFCATGSRIEGGAIVRCRNDSEIELADDDLAEIDARGLTLSVHQTPRHFLVSGAAHDIARWHEEVAGPRRFSVKPLYRLPLHSQGMRAAFEAVRPIVREAPRARWNVPVVSSVTTSVLETRAQLERDLEANILGPVRWWQTFRFMVEKLGVRRFINIGPGKTLIRFCERIPLPTPVEVIDLFAHAPPSPQHDGVT